MDADRDRFAFATGGAPAAVAETHVAVVFFVGDRAYKLKKPVRTGFLDFRSRQARLDACRREVALNRRIAADVYLGVADLCGPDGEPYDHLVVMRRMPADRRLSSLVAAGRPVDDELARLADLLARFHDRCPTSPEVEEAAGRDAQAARWEANAAEMAPFAGHVFDEDRAGEVLALARRYLAGRRPAFDRRIARGRARDGHGDLLADDIFCLDDGPRVLDCLEFDDRLRYGDVLADVAFLAMDLERLGRPDLATLFLDEYARTARDHWPASLAHHYIAYRAQVRAKVACLRWEQGDAGSAATADALVALARDHLRAGRVRLVLVGGLPGTGKTTVATAVGGQLGAAVLRSDEVRKELAGLDRLTAAPAPLDEGLYDPSMTAATYAELLCRARGLLGQGQTVVLDASWRHPSWREEARRLARDTSSDLVELRCVAPLEVAVERVARRRARGGDPSDASPEVARALAAEEQGWTSATDLDTSQPRAAVVRDAMAVIDGVDQHA